MATASQRALDYLEQLPGTTFAKLYQQPSTALAIFRRFLPHLAKTLVMAMLYMPDAWASADLDVWFKPSFDGMRARDWAVTRLQDLRILSEGKHPKTGKVAYKLSPEFGKSLRAALTGGGHHRSFGVPSPAPEKMAMTVEDLDTYARKQWEAILYYIVSSVDGGMQTKKGISAGTEGLLQSGGYVATKSGGRQRTITKTGFTFLLQEVNAQVWSLLVGYLEICPRLQMDEIEVLSFLFTLGSLELGTSYSTSNLSPSQTRLLEDLQDFGLVYRLPNDTERYYPTRLATTLTSDAPALLTSSLTTTTMPKPSSDSSPEAEKGYIILETNYRLYAYTNSPLLISILNLFSSLHTRYPNLVTAKITKSSIQEAISLGISAKQIISYLSTHAHPIMKRAAAIHQAPIIPATVSDQIRLWEIEGERMKSTQGVLIKDIAPEDYEKAKFFADSIGVLVKAFDHKRMLFVTRSDQFTSWFARRKQEKQAAQAQRAAAAGRA